LRTTVASQRTGPRPLIGNTPKQPGSWRGSLLYDARSFACAVSDCASPAARNAAFFKAIGHAAVKAVGPDSRR
jgi:hypothetical protein